MADPTPSASMVENPANAISVFHSMDTVHCVHLVYSYLLLHVNTLHICFSFRASFLSVLVLNPAVSRGTTLTSTVPSGLMAAEFLLFHFSSTYSYDVCALACWRFMVADIPRPCLRTGSVPLLWDGVLITPSQVH